MPVFKRRNETPLERELAAARAWRDQLKGRRINAQRALDHAIAERRRTQTRSAPASQNGRPLPGSPTAVAYTACARAARSVSTTTTAWR